MFAIEIIVAIEEIKVIKVWHDCFACQGGFLLSPSCPAAGFTPSVLCLHFFVRPSLSCPRLVSHQSFFWASLCPWPLLDSHNFQFHRSSSIFLSRSICESSGLFVPAGPSRGIDEQSGPLTVITDPFPQPSFGL